MNLYVNTNFKNSVKKSMYLMIMYGNVCVSLTQQKKLFAAIIWVLP